MRREHDSLEGIACSFVMPFFCKESCSQRLIVNDKRRVLVKITTPSLKNMLKLELTNSSNLEGPVYSSFPTVN